MAALFGRRLRRGATSTAVAAAAIAALAASQAPGATPAPRPDGGTTADVTPPVADTVTGGSQYYTELPPLNTPNKPGSSIGEPGAQGPAEAGIPASVLAAYRQAEATLKESKPQCRLPWQLLAAIGKVESGQARGGQVDAQGTTNAPILGPVLNGAGFANIPDTDGGQYDGDSVHDRAVGPMQFIPSTWATWGRDANGDGAKDPNNVFDAALAAGLYLCAGDRDLSIDSERNAAILSYNHSQEYLNTVLSWLEFYRNGTHEVPDGSGVLPAGNGPLNPEPSTSPSASPSTSPSVDATHPPSKPHKPGTPKPSGGSGSPTTPPTTPPGEGPSTPPGDGGSPGGPTTPPAQPVVGHLEKAGGDGLSAVAGSLFGGRATVKAETDAGKPVAGTAVQFEIVGDTDAHFDGAPAKIVVTTGKDGTATAPAVRAGEKAGSFTVKASVKTGGVAAVEYAATVTARQADTIARTDDAALTAAPGAEFANPVTVKATLKGAAVAGTAVKVSMVTADAGPYFKDEAGKPVRALDGLKTDADGKLQLPKIYAEDAAGTFDLRIEAAGGAVLTVHLTVEAPK